MGDCRALTPVEAVRSALLRYFDEPPSEIYVQVKPKTVGG